MGGGHHSFTPAAMPKEDQDWEALKAHQVPLSYRDTCAHLLIPLNSCRRKTWFHPEKCNPERHLYEECEYIAWLQRVEAKKQQTRIAGELAKEAKK